jgi:hypothetical protein
LGEVGKNEIEIERERSKFVTSYLHILSTKKIAEDDFDFGHF